MRKITTANKMSFEHPVAEFSFPQHSGSSKRADIAEVIPLHGERRRRDYGMRPLVHGEAMVEGGDAPVTYTLAVPEEISAETIAVGVNGFGAFKRTSRDFRNRLATAEGIPSLSYDPLRKSASGFKTAHLRDPQQLHVNTLTAIANHIESRRDLPRAVRRLAKDAPYALVPHSMGELAAVRWLETDENAAKTAVVVHLGALGIGPLKPLQIIRRTAAVLKNDVAPGMLAGEYGKSPQVIRRSARYLLSCPSQTAAEIVSCLFADATLSVRTLAETGVPQSIVAMSEDDFFYADEMRASVGDIIDDIVIIAGPHTAPQRKPAVVAQAVGAIIRRHTA